MLFEELGRLKRNSIMLAVILAAVGIVMVICPETYIGFLIGALGVVMLIAAVVLVLDFISSKKALLNFVMLTLALVLAIIGTMILIAEINTLYAIAWIFGILLIISGLHSLFHTLTFARRSGRKGWGVLVPLSLLTVIAGVVIIWNPWWSIPSDLMMIIGWTVVYAAVVSALRLIWIWPIKDK